CPPTCPITVLVEPFGGFLDPERTRSAVPRRIDSKDQADELRFDRINFEALLDLGATTLGLDDAIAEGRSRTVPKALLGRFAHRADDVLAVLARCIFVEDANDLRISSCEGSSPVGWVTETTSTPCLRILRMVSSISAPLR